MANTKKVATKDEVVENNAVVEEEAMENNAVAEEEAMVDENDPWRKVKIKLPLKKGVDGLYVNVNNHNYYIPRGKIVEVPLFIAKVIENSANQDEATMMKIAQLTNGAS